MEYIINIDNVFVRVAVNNFDIVVKVTPEQYREKLIERGIIKQSGDVYTIKTN